MRRRLCGRLAGLLLLVVLALPRPCLAGPAVVFHGNETEVDGELVDSALLAAMDLSEGARAARATAERAARNLRRFLDRKGYDRAGVQVVAEDDVLHVFVDEGRFERIAFHGQSSWKTVQLKLDLRLPDGAFSRTRIEREMARLKKKFDIEKLRWEVREAAGGVASKRRPLGYEGLTVQLLAAREPSAYELHVFVGDGAWGEGWGLGVQTGGPDGLVLDGSWSHDALFFETDRYRLDTLLGAWLRRPLDGGELMLVLTRAEQRLRWLTPPLAGKWLRLDVRGAFGTQHVQRADLRIDSAWRFGVETSANLDLQLFEFFETAVGVGYQMAGAAGLNLASGAGPVPSDLRARPFVRLASTVSQDSPTLRLDRQDFVTLAVQVDGLGGDPVYHLSGDARTGFELGWHELILRGRAAFVDGPGVVWWDEASLSSSAFRVAPPGVGYARVVAQASGEVRLSLRRDTFKLGTFVGTSLHSDGIPGSALEGRTGFAAVAGLCAHFLLLDEFQFDAYYGGVVDQAGRFGQGLTLGLRKIY